MIRALCVAAVAAAVLAPVARADPAADDHFIAMLENVGGTWQNRDAIINNGHYVCNRLWSGTETFEDQVNTLLAVEPAMDEKSARTFVAIAIVAFCPDISARRKVTS